MGGRTAICLAIAISGIVAEAAATEPKKPNILFIVIDNVGYGDLACYDNAVNRMPNIDHWPTNKARLQAPAKTPTPP
jgi:hypothetical protein